MVNNTTTTTNMADMERKQAEAWQRLNLVAASRAGNGNGVCIAVRELLAVGATYITMEQAFGLPAHRFQRWAQRECVPTRAAMAAIVAYVDADESPPPEPTPEAEPMPFSTRPDCNEADLMNDQRDAPYDPTTPTHRLAGLLTVINVETMRDGRIAVEFERGDDSYFRLRLRPEVALSLSSHIRAVYESSCSSDIPVSTTMRVTDAYDGGDADSED